MTATPTSAPIMAATTDCYNGSINCGSSRGSRSTNAVSSVTAAAQSSPTAAVTEAVGAPVTESVTEAVRAPVTEAVRA